MRKPRQKRRYGTGSVLQRPDGLYVAQVSFGRREDGKRDRRSFSSRVRSEVEIWLDNQRPWDPDPDGLPVPRHRVDAWLERWLAGVGPQVRPTTVRRYEELCRVWITPLIGTLPFARLTAADVRRIPAAMTRAGRSPATAAAALTVLRMALNQAVRDGYLARNVAESVKAPRLTSEPIRAISVDEANAVLAATKASSIGPLVAVAMGTGLRIGELLALRSSDVRPDAVVVTGSIRPVPRAEGKGYQLVRESPKTKRSIRTVALTELARKGIADERQRHPRVGYIFATADGQPLDPRNVTRAFSLQLKRAGLPAMRFHDLRHAYATLMLAAGVPLRVVQHSLGHTSIALTAAVYAHVLPELSRSSADQFDRLLAKSSANGDPSSRA